MFTESVAGKQRFFAIKKERHSEDLIDKSMLTSGRRQHHQIIKKRPFRIILQNVILSCQI